VVETGDATQHPELELARWAAARLTPEQRAQCTVYTSGEHCPMCAAAHGWVGLGRIMYVTAAHQLSAWLAEAGIAAAPVAPLPIQQSQRAWSSQGPVDELVDEVRRLQLRFHGRDVA
jgi:tRNA(Arg) A34 adenosine deaminase TadA